MSYKQIERIKTALSDGSCESVSIEIRDKIPNWNGVVLLTSDNIESIDCLQYCAIKSVKYNRRTCADLGVGDIVDTPDGEGFLYAESYLFDVKIKDSEIMREYHRHELILLEKRNDK